MLNISIETHVWNSDLRHFCAAEALIMRGFVTWKPKKQLKTLSRTEPNFRTSLWAGVFFSGGGVANMFENML